MFVLALFLLTLTGDSFGQLCSLNQTEANEIIAELEQEGFLVQRGKMYFPPLDCAYVSRPSGCNFNNPTTPYSLALLPFAPEEKGRVYPHDPEFLHNTTDIGAANMREKWKLRQDESVVLFGCTPPSLRYYGVSHYLSFRFRHIFGKPWGYKNVLGSLGNPLNQLSLKTEDKKLFDSRYGLQMSGDQRTVNSVKSILSKHLENGSHENVLPVSKYLFDDRNDTIQFGLGPYDDYLLLVSRYALPEDWEAWNAYVENPQTLVLRVTPRSPFEERSAQPFPPPTLLSRHTENPEHYLQPALDTLRTAVREDIEDKGSEAWHSWFSMRATSLIMADWGGDCVSGMMVRFCYGETPDALYSAIFPTFTLQKDEYLIVMGVNHHATGQAEYSNITPNNLRLRLGLFSVTDKEFVGSARRFLSGSKYEDIADKLYAYKFAYQCAPEDDYCVEIAPEGAFGVAPGNGMMFLERSYLNPSTTTGAHFEELLDPTYIIARKPGRGIPFGRSVHDILWFFIGFVMEYKPQAAFIAVVVMLSVAIAMKKCLLGCCCSRSRRREGKTKHE